MKKCLSIQFYLLSVILLFVVLETQAQLKIDLQYRPRFEVRNGYQKLASEGSIPALFVSQRSRVTLTYNNEYLKLKLTPQDARVWGDEQLESTTGVFGDYASIDLSEAYAELKLGTLGWLSVGRQILKYDNSRLLSDRNWNQTGLSYDAVVLKLAPKDFNLHVGAVWNTLTEAGTENLYPTDRLKSIDFLWLNKKFSEKFSASLLHIASGLTQTDTTSKLNFRQTTGLYTEYNTDGFNIWADAYYQYGKSQQSISVSAFLFDVVTSYHIRMVTPALGFSYLSGNSKTGTNQKTDHLFDMLYGTRHSYFGLIDYFRNFSKDTKQGGLIDLYYTLNVNLSQKINMQDAGHFFSLAQTNAETPSDKALGYENDLVVKFNFSDWGGLESGYMFFLPTNTLRTIQNVTNNKFSQYFYLQLVITANIFKQQE